MEIKRPVHVTKHQSSAGHCIILSFFSVFSHSWKPNPWHNHQMNFIEEHLLVFLIPTAVFRQILCSWTSIQLHTSVCPRFCIQPEIEDLRCWIEIMSFVPCGWQPTTFSTLVYIQTLFIIPYPSLYWFSTAMRILDCPKKIFRSCLLNVKLLQSFFSFVSFVW